MRARNAEARCFQLIFSETVPRQI